MRHLLTLAILLIAISSFSQAPQGINYQAVAHDISGEPLSGQTITVRIGILSSSASGNLEWEETHGVTTNSYGLFDLVVGMGSSTGGGNQANFSDINWGGTSHFMRVEIDGGSGFEAIGTTQLLSVPYALHAKTVENDQVDDADADATNELITGGTLNGTDLEITDAGGTTTIDLSGLSGGSGDDWGAQVVESDATLNGDGTTTSPLSVNGDLTDDQTLTYTPATQALDISGGNSVTLSVDDADADPNNELITGGSLSGTDLIITDAGGSTTIDLSPLNTSDTLPIIKNAANTFVSAINNNQVDIGFAGNPHYVLGDDSRIAMPQSNGNMFMGGNPGGTTLTSGAGNIGIGSSSLNNITTGSVNIGIGQAALASETTGGWNVGIGLNTLQNVNGGVENVAIGRDALPGLVSGADNIALGSRTLELVTSGNTNIAIGRNAGSYITGGSQNVLIGYNAGSTGVTTNQSGNIKIGAGAGANDTGNNKLYIDNQGTVMPLIYGNLASDSLKIFGSLSVGEEYTFPLSDGNPGEVLSTDGAGNTSWQNISAGDFFANGSVSMTGNFQTGGNFISNDGDNEGIQVSNTGLVTLTPATTGAGNYALLTSGDIRTTGQGTGLHLTNNQIRITGNNGNAGNMHFYTGNTERMRIHAGGNVEVYNRTQTNTLTVSSGAGTSGNVLTDDGTGNAVWALPSADNDWTTGTNVIYNVTDSVGIGTFSPTTKLEVFGTSNESNLYTFNGSPSTTIAIHNDDLGNSNYSSLSFTTRASNNGTYNSARIAAVNQNHTAGSMSSDLVFMTREPANITEAMRITGDNRIGIGTVNPSTDLHLNGDMRIQNGTEGAGHILTSDAAGNATWKPKSVAFYAGMDPSGGTQTVSQNVPTTLVFQSGTSSFALNDGGGYNNASGQFQAPVAGVYQFNVNIITAGAVSGYFKLNLVHSSGNHIAEKNGFFNTITQAWNSETITVTVHLNAGESVWVEMYNTNGGASFYRDQSSFSGHLVYAD